MIVFDSSTLILLARTELGEEFLSAINQQAVIPKEVEKESCEEKGSPDAILIRRLIQERTIAVKTLKDRKLHEKVRADFTVGRGEAEAIALAFSEKARLLGTDDRKAVQACRLLKIPYTTAIGILVRMYEKGALNKEQARLKLEALEKYGWYKKGIIADAKSKIEVG